MAFRSLAALLVLACCLSLGVRAGADDSLASDATGSLDVGGVTRTYVIHVPAKLPTSAPLVLSFHGHFSNGAEQSRLTKLDGLSEANGFIAVYPNGIDRSWNDGRPQDAGADDIAFVRALIVELSSRYAIDSRRMYATGFSNGASFAEFLGCRLADRIAAIAPVSGYLPVDDVAGCHPARAISVLAIGGTADPIEPYAGGEVQIGTIDRGTVRSANDTIAFWAANAGCASQPVVETLASDAPPDGTSVTRATFPRCRDGVSVVLDTITGGGHTWPGGPQYARVSFIGIASGQLAATQAIVDFFYANPMR